MSAATTVSLIDRASSLAERMTSRVERLTPEQVERWRSNAASGNEGKFSRRMEWTATSSQPPYWWAPSLMELLDWTRSRPAAGFAPLVEFALHRLSVPVPEALRPALVTALRRTLTVVAEQALAADAELFERGGWPAISEKYPVLAKLMAIRIQFWAVETSEFLERLEREMPRLQPAGFGAGSEVRPVPAGSVIDFVVRSIAGRGSVSRSFV